MGLSINTHVYTGGDRVFPVSFALGFLDRTHVSVYIEGEIDGLGDVVYRDFTWNSDSEIVITDPIEASSNNPKNVVIQRTVSKQELIVDFSQEGTATRQNVQYALSQAMMAMHEFLDGRIEPLEAVYPFSAYLTQIKDAYTDFQEVAEELRATAEETNTAIAGLDLDNLLRLTGSSQTMRKELLIDVGTGQVALNVMNGEIVGVNGVEFSDTSNHPSEGIRFPKVGATKNTQGQFEDDDVDTIRVYKGIPRLNRQELLVNRPSYQETVLLSDAQPDANPDTEATDGQQADQVQKWRDILDSITTYHPDVTSMIFAGDAVDRGHPSLSEITSNSNPWYSFEDFQNDLRTRLLFNEINVVAGNHDRNYLAFSDRLELDPFGYFKGYFQKSFYYNVKGNTVYIFMGDMGSGTEGYITKFVFDWWYKVCRAFRGHNIVCVTHQLLPNTFNGTIGAATDDTLIMQGSRFIDAMTTYPVEERVTNVALWISGHTNASTATDISHQFVNAHGTSFVNCGLHIPTDSEGGERDLTYVIMETTDGSADVVLKRWNHKTNAFITGAEQVVTFPYKLVLSSVPEHNGQYSKSDLDLNMDTQVTHMHVRHIANGNPNNYDTEPHWLHDLIVDDRYGGNMISGIKGGIRVNLPGGQGGEADELTHGYGVAGGFYIEKEDNGDSDYSGEFVGLASTAAKDDSSLVEAFRGHKDGSLSSPAGFRTHFKSAWIAVNNDDSFEITHNLGSTELEVVYFQIRTVADGRIFDAPRQNAVSRGITVEYKDNNTIELAVANTDVWYRDNTHTGHTAESFDGTSAGEEVEVRIALRKVP